MQLPALRGKLIGAARAVVYPRLTNVNQLGIFDRQQAEDAVDCIPAGISWTIHPPIHVIRWVQLFAMNWLFPVVTQTSVPSLQPQVNAHIMRESVSTTDLRNSARASSGIEPAERGCSCS